MRNRIRWKSVLGRGLLLIILLALLAILTIPDRPAAFAQPVLAAPGPHAAGWRLVTVTRPDSSTFSAFMTYPATSPGENAPFDPSGGPYPALSFGHSFFSQPEYNQSLLEHLATHGYIVIATKTETGFSPNHINYAADIRYCLTYLEQQNASNGSPLYQKVRTEDFGVFGYSMGGGASVLAASEDTRIKVVANMAAAVSQSAPTLEAAADLKVPMRMLAGSEDGIATLADHQQPIYDAAPAPKQLAVFQGGYHCGFSEIESPIPFFCDSGSMERSVQLSLTAEWLTTWFDYYLKGDTSLRPLVWGDQLDDDPRVVVQSLQADALFEQHYYQPLILNQR